MLALLDETDQRRIHLLDILMHQSQWITIGELAQQVEASERTVHSDLVHIKNAWGKKLQIDVSLKNGVQLGCRSMAALHEILIDIYKRAVAPRFLCDLFFFADQTLEFYTKKLFVSKSTLARQIPKINGYLAQMNVSIERNGLCYHFAAQDEQALRKLLSATYVELTPGLTYKHSAQLELNVPGATGAVDFEHMCAIVRTMFQQRPESTNAEFVLSDSLILPQMVAFYLVSLIRESQGFHVASSRPLGAEISPENLKYLADLFPTISSESLQPIHALLMQPCHEPSSKDDIFLLEREIDAFYQRIFAALHVSCPPQVLVKLKQALKVLYHYALFSPVNAAGFFHRINGFASSVQTCHPGLFAAFEDSLAAFSDAMQVDLSPALPDLLMRACLIFPALAMAAPPKRIFIVSDSGVEHAEFLANFIRSFFCGACYETVHITLLHYADALESAFASHYTKEDILITNDPDLLSLLSDRTVVLFHDFPTPENLGQLYDAIYRK